MIRIVGVQRSENIGQEFILLQNQGSMRVYLKGHAVLADAALIDGASSPAVHLFADEVDVLPGQYILLRTCPGSAHWSATNEGQRVYHTYMARLGPVWVRFPVPFHVLAPQHSYSERQAEALLV